MKDLNLTTPMCAVNVDAGKASISEECRGDRPCYFALLNLQPHFNVNLPDLSKRYLELAGSLHPDRFVDANEREKRIALEHSANLNEAYQVIKSPTQRARYLLSLKGKELSLETTVQDPEFLMQQMQWHEELEELEAQSDLDAISLFKDRVKQLQTELEQKFAESWQDKECYLYAEQLVRRMQFMDKLMLSTKQLEEHLDN